METPAEVVRDLVEKHQYDQLIRPEKGRWDAKPGKIIEADKRRETISQLKSGDLAFVRPKEAIKRKRGPVKLSK